MAALNEYNVVGGLIGLGEFILLEIVSESIDLEDVQQIVYIPISVTVPKGDYTKKDDEFTFTSNTVFGIKKSGLIIPFGKRPQDQPYAKGNIGPVKQNDIETYGNQLMNQGDLISEEVNMDIVPRTVKLFINGNLQPIYMSGIPDSIQFYFSLWATGNTITVLSLKRLAQSTDATVQGAKEVKWE
ncbi:MAG: hypothetical protein EZS28_037508 [Streblomastix strix]|uniref:Uncharacterized protein n=1 Tax=Streblomastix strix TaxID=222440 RepID=A0A5J4UBG1_9EUKA|nr:MAG: hypothetical protein EZS28_037508 [Streblomastix strix]